MTDSSIQSSLVELTSAALTERLATLLGKERDCVVDFLWHLAEMDRRRAFVAMGYGSTFDWCHRAMKLSKGKCWRRVTAARLLLKFPVIDGYLRDGRLCLTTLVPLDEVLDEHNHLDVLERAADKTEDEVKVLVATLRPRPPVPDSIRRLPTPRTDAPVESTPLFAAPPPVSTAAPAKPGSGPERKVNTPVDPVVPIAAEVRRPRVEPLNATQHSVKFTAGPEFMALLKEARSVLSHVVPDGNLEAILRECMKKALEVCARRQRGAVSAPKSRAESVNGSDDSATTAKPPKVTPTKTPPTKRSRYVPAAVRRVVWKRDGGRCTFVGPDGTRCGSTHTLQLDHLKPFARGGEATAENLTVRCLSHNLYRAYLHFGEAHMAKFTRRSRGFRRSPDSSTLTTAPPNELERLRDGAASSDLGPPRATSG